MMEADAKLNRRDAMKALIYTGIGLVLGLLVPKKCHQEPPEVAKMSEWQYTRTFQIDCAVNEKPTNPIAIECVYNVKRMNKAPGYTLELISMKAVGDYD